MPKRKHQSTETESDESSNPDPDYEVGDFLNYGEYEILEKLGKGATFKVYLCRSVKTEQRVAMKCVNAAYHTSGNHELKMFQILNRKEKQCCITMLGHFTVGKSVHIVFERMSGNLNLTQVIRDRDLNTKEIKILSCKLLTAISELHGAELRHSDLKPDNILTKNLYERNIAECVVKLGDLGTARYGQCSTITRVGTKRYRALETIMGAKSDKSIDLCTVVKIMT
jgi:serine/threonine protein kinase